MARIANRVLLGFEDEPITEKYKDQINFTTNKIGGKPDWPGDAPTAVTCKLCSLNLPLVLQIYAPLDYSPYHRTLYIFACINPNCWNQNGSWVCLRSQLLDSRAENYGNVQKLDCNEINDWCGGGDDWGDEENGNIINGTKDLMNAEDLARGISDMEICAADEKNANSCGSGEGAIGLVPMATATIEGDEGEVVCIDSPTAPRVNLIAVLEETAPLPQVPVSRLEFSPFFVSVIEEELCYAPPPSPTEMDIALLSHQRDDENMGEEKYEKTLPAHGDKMFYQLVSRIQANPGQILRYGGFPLPLYTMSERPRTCRSCGGDVTFELQILPTLIPKLKLHQSSDTHLEFGSVFLFSCRQSCWTPQDSYKEEELVVQAERI